jgi:hypothetical protein
MDPHPPEVLFVCAPPIPPTGEEVGLADDHRPLTDADCAQRRERAAWALEHFTRIAAARIQPGSVCWVRSMSSVLLAVGAISQPRQPASRAPGDKEGRRFRPVAPIGASSQSRLVASARLMLNQGVDAEIPGTDPTNDTSPDALRLLIDGYRAMAPERKIQIVRELNRRTSALAMADIRRRHPDAPERENLFRLAARRMDPELLRKHFGWDVRVHGY